MVRNYSSSSLKLSPVSESISAKETPPISAFGYSSLKICSNTFIKAAIVGGGANAFAVLLHRLLHHRDSFQILSRHMVWAWIEGGYPIASALAAYKLMKMFFLSWGCAPSTSAFLGGGLLGYLYYGSSNKENAQTTLHVFRLLTDAIVAPALVAQPPLHSFLVFWTIGWLLVTFQRAPHYLDEGFANVLRYVLKDPPRVTLVQNNSLNDEVYF